MPDAEEPQVRFRRQCRVAALAVAGVLLLGVFACGLAEEEGAPSKPSLSETNSQAPDVEPISERVPAPIQGGSPSESVATNPAAPEGPELPTVQTPPLDDLLRLPDSVKESLGEVETPDPSRAGAEGMTPEEREAARLRLEVDSRKDTAGFDPDNIRTRRRTEAGVAVDVDEKTSVRGGVRVEQEPDEEWREPVPTVGVEKRF